jgi:hypothetical protein
MIFLETRFDSCKNRTFASNCVHPRFLVVPVVLIFFTFLFCVYCLFVFVLCLVYPMLPVSQFLFELQLLISPVVSSNFAIAVHMVIIIKRKLCYHMCYRNVKIRTFFLTGTQLSTLLFIPGKDSPREYPSLPSPRRISNELFSAKGRKLFSYRNTVQLMAWGHIW